MIPAQSERKKKRDYKKWNGRGKCKSKFENVKFMLTLAELF